MIAEHRTVGETILVWIIRPWWNDGRVVGFDGRDVGNRCMAYFSIAALPFLAVNDNCPCGYRP